MGYKMVVIIYFDGNGAGHKKCVSLFVQLLPGIYDDLLTWPFPHTIMLSILDQSDYEEQHKEHITSSFTSNSSENFYRPKTDDHNRAIGVPKFADKAILKNSKYVKINTLSIKCTVHIH